MKESARDATWVHSIDLAQEADFDLGSLSVRPARCEVESGGVSQSLQRRVMQVLVALAGARGSVVSHNDLVIRCWRGLSVSDDAIVRCISMLRKLAADYPEPPFAIETIPGVGYRLTSSRFAEDRPAATAKRQARLPAWIAGATLLVAILAGIVLWNNRHWTAGDAHPTSVTVQPFETLGNSSQTQSLARSVPNEVVDALGDSQIEAALAGADAGKASKPSGLVVTGVVRDDATNSVVGVRIEAGATRRALWSAEFRRRNSEVSDLPLEVAARVTDVVNMINFARNADPPLTDDTALSALLQTTDMIRDARGGAWAQMIEHAQGVVARYPKFAFGHDVLAYAYWEAADNIDVPDRARAMSNAARREANLTLKLDPQDAGAYAILAGQEASYDYGAQEAILLRGIKTARHPKEALGGLYSGESGLLQNVGRLREGLTIQLSAHAVDQWGAPKTAKLAFTYANMGDLATARELIEKGIRLWPNHSGIRAKRQFIAGFYEDPSDALKIFDSLDALHSPDESNAIWRTYIEARATHSARVSGAALDRIRHAADKGVIPREIEIMMLAGLGETEAAIGAANSALDHQQRLEAWVLFTPITKGLLTDRGFVPLAGRLGLIRYWRGTGKWPDFCTDQARGSECSPQLVAALRA